MRAVSLQSQLAQVGVQDTNRAQKLLADPIMQNVDQNWLLSLLANLPDPDQALLNYLRLIESTQQHSKEAQDSLYYICEDTQATQRLFSILGYSAFLSDFLIANPQQVAVLGNQAIVNGNTSFHLFTLHTQTAIPFDYQQAIHQLRAQYWGRILQIAAQDLTSPHSKAEFSQIANSISTLVSHTLEQALEIAISQHPHGAKISFAILALGKTGAREVNYISDVDVMYIAQPKTEELSENEAVRVATELAQSIAKIVFSPAGMPSLWQLDANLRPEGKDGPLVRTLASYQDYYQRWAQSWEFQALLKARVVAGDRELGQALIDFVQPLVWNVVQRESFVQDSQQMRQRVENIAELKDAQRQLKLGKGGLRDVEFTVQLLQLVHGRTDPNLRVAATLDGLTALSQGGYVSRTQAENLAKNYQFLRTLEHRIQLLRFKRSHLIPDNMQDLKRIARSLRGTNLREAADLQALIKQVQAEVRKAHLEIFYRPLLPEVARLSADDVSLDKEAAKARLQAIGYKDPRSAIAHIKALTAGISRTAVIQRHLLPVMLGWFGQGPEPDAALKAFRVLSEQMGSTSWYMRTLRDSGTAGEQLAQVLSHSRYVANEMPALSESITWLADKEALLPRSAQELQEELLALLSRRSTPLEIVTAGRYLRRKELLRTAIGQVLGLISATQVRQAITNAADIAVHAAYVAATAATQESFSLTGQAPLAEIAVIALGRYGGGELTYASDIDVMFVHEGSDEYAYKFAQHFRQLLAHTSNEPALMVDMDLRPEGKNGPLSRTLASYSAYYERWGETWERQALLRARFGAGSQELGEKFLTLIAPVRYPAAGLTDIQVRDIRLLKLRMERERIPKSVDPLMQLKLGRGGLTDVEWVAQLWQLQLAAKYPQLQITATLEVLDVLTELSVLTATQCDTLKSAWETASRLRDFNVLSTGQMLSSKVDILPHDSDSLAVLAALWGEHIHSRQDVVDAYLRIARQARQIVEQLFYGTVENENSM